MSVRANLYKRWLRDVSYQRPGYRLNWSDEHGLEISVDTYDSDNPPEVIEQTHAFGYPSEDVNKAEFMDWLAQRILLQSYHEVAEFFQVYGSRWFHPHDPEAFARLVEAMENARLA